jgi:hypothetical protein
MPRGAWVAGASVDATCSRSVAGAAGGADASPASAASPACAASWSGRRAGVGSAPRSGKGAWSGDEVASVRAACSARWASRPGVSAGGSAVGRSSGSGGCGSLAVAGSERATWEVDDAVASGAGTEPSRAGGSGSRSDSVAGAGAGPEGVVGSADPSSPGGSATSCPAGVGVEGGATLECSEGGGGVEGTEGVGGVERTEGGGGVGGSMPGRPGDEESPVRELRCSPGASVRVPDDVPGRGACRHSGRSRSCSGAVCSCSGTVCSCPGAVSSCSRPSCEAERSGASDVDGEAHRVPGLSVGSPSVPAACWDAGGVAVGPGSPGSETWPSWSPGAGAGGRAVWSSAAGVPERSCGSRDGVVASRVQRSSPPAGAGVGRSRTGSP